jgi:hypothetical protein
MEKERRITIEILDEFEELLDRKGISIPSADREADGQNEACLYGSEYYEVEDAITDILKEEYPDG